MCCTSPSASCQSSISTTLPAHRYERATDRWIDGSDLTDFHGGTRELFVTCKEFILYAGSYKCHDLRALQPEGSALPSQIVSIHGADLAQVCQIDHCSTVTI
jgi:hypothetical protein